MERSRPRLIAGPTASGKSALALRLADALDGVIINADSQQVYAGWRVLTARPSAEDERAAPHRLYGHVAPGERYSVGAWLGAVRAILTEETGRTPIIVGGTGLYFQALTKGLSDIPAIAPDILTEAEGADPARLLPDLDARTLERIDTRNPARVRRAWAVQRATGRGMAEWAARTPPPLLPLEKTEPMLVTLDRAVLHARADARFDAMLHEGALEEARAMAALGLPPALPAMKAVGAPELFAFLSGEATLEQAAENAKAATRRYIKRQETWFRQRMRGWTRVAG